VYVEFENKGTLWVSEVCVHRMLLGLLLLLFGALGRQSLAKEFRVLNIAWLSSNGTIPTQPDLPSFTASLWIPLAVKHFNERSNDVLPLSSLVPSSCDATLTLVGGVQDDELTPKLAMREFLAGANNADVLLGPVLSETAVSVAVASAALSMPQVSFGAAADQLSNKLEFPTFFRMASTDSQSGEALASLFQSFGYQKVGLISVNNAFGLAIKTALQRECRDRNIQLYVQEYEDIVGPDLDSQAYAALQVMKTFRLNVIVYAATHFEFIYALAKAAEQLNWSIGRLFISHVALADYGKVTPEQVSYSIRFLNGSLHIQPTVDQTLSGFQNLLRAWPKQNASYLNPLLPQKFRVPANYFSLGQQKGAGRGWAWAYDSVITIGLAACGLSTSLQANLRDVDFVGTSGRVKFIPTTQDRDPSAFVYTLDNIQLKPDGTPIGQPIVGILSDRQGGKWNFTRPILFNSGTTPPKDTDPPQNVIVTIPFGAKIYGWIGSAIAVLASLIALGYLLKHRKERIIVESQPTYLAFLAVGAGLMAISIIALTIESDGGCMAFPWLFSAGLTLAMASLAVKSARIAIYWHHRGKISNFKRILGTRILPAGMWLILLVDLAILLAWQLTAPWVLTMIVFQQDSFGNPLRSSLVCTSPNDTSSAFIGALIGYMILIAIVTGFVSFRVRNAPRRYHEAKMTALAGVSMFQVFLVAAPAAYAVWLMPLPRFLVLSSMSFLLCMIILVTMFAPKVFKVRFLGSMAAKTAANKTKKGTAPRAVSFGGKTERVIDEEQGQAPDAASNDPSKPPTSVRLVDLAPSRPVADWKLMILGIRSENESVQSEPPSPPEHDYVGDSDSPPEHERRESDSPPDQVLQRTSFPHAIFPPSNTTGANIARATAMADATNSAEANPAHGGDGSFDVARV
jgi:hypothetical protein